MTFKEWLRESITSYNPEGYDDDEVDMTDMADQAHTVARGSGINILRNKELASTYRDSSGKVLGALYTSIEQNVFSFDVVVRPDVQGQGIGTKLVQDAINTYNSYKWDDPDLKIEADVVSVVMERILTKIGWKVIQKIGGHTLMAPKL